MKRIILAVLPVLLMSGCSTENQQNQQVTAAQPLTQPTTAEQATQTTQAQADGQPATTTQTNPKTGAEQTQVVSNAYLTASEIQAQFIGVKWNWITNSSRNNKGTVLYNSNNTIQWKSGRFSNGSGQWRMEGDNLCTYFPARGQFKGIPWNCNPVTRQGEKYIRGSTTYTKS